MADTKLTYYLKTDPEIIKYNKCKKIFFLGWKDMHSIKKRTSVLRSNYFDVFNLFKNWCFFNYFLCVFHAKFFLSFVLLFL